MLVRSVAEDPRSSYKVQRPSSPDSACSSDHDSSPASISSCSTGIQNLRFKTTGPLSTTRKNALARHSSRKATPDSDCDSGIVSERYQTSRVGSTSSTDTDTGQLYPKLRPDPLSVGKDQSAHYDDYLSEENIRSSCRKLLATLYSHKASSPLTSNCNKVRRNNSCDNLQSSLPAQNKRKSCHRLSLQNPSYQDKDMIQVYARPVTVIPDQPTQTLGRNQQRWKHNTLQKRNVQHVQQTEHIPPEEFHQKRNVHHVQRTGLATPPEVLHPKRNVHHVKRTEQTSPEEFHQKRNVHQMKQTEQAIPPEEFHQKKNIHHVQRTVQSINPNQSGEFHQKGLNLIHNKNAELESERQSCKNGTCETVSRNSSLGFRPWTKRAPTSRLSWDDHAYTGSDVPRHQLVSDFSGAVVEYAVVDRNKKTCRRLPEHVTSQPCLTMPPGEGPKKTMHKSDLTLYRGPGSTSSDSSSKRTLLERVQDLSRSARTVLRKAFSTERIYRPHRQERQEAEPNRTSLVKGIRTRISSRGASKKASALQHMQALRIESGRNPMWDDVDSVNSQPGMEQTWGQLLQLNVDGSQVIELSRPPAKPFGFFVARGRVKETKGVFVSRMQDDVTRQQLAGLLEVGDEILEIEAVDVRGADILEVNALMARKRTLLLTVLPYICRKDI